MWKAKCPWENPSNCQLPFLSFFPNHLFLPECGWVSYCVEWEECGQKFELGKEPIFEKCVLTSMARKMPKNVCHFPMHPCFPFSSPFSFTLGILGSNWSFSCVFFIPRFWLLASFFPWMGGRFCSAGDWAVFLTFWELLVHFPFTFLQFHVFLPWLWSVFVNF